MRAIRINPAQEKPGPRPGFTLRAATSVSGDLRDFHSPFAPRGVGVVLSAVAGRDDFRLITDAKSFFNPANEIRPGLEAPAPIFRRIYKHLWCAKHTSARFRNGIAQ